MLYLGLFWFLQHLFLFAQKYVPKRLAAKNYFGTLEKLLSQWKGPLRSECVVQGTQDSDEYDSEWTSVEVLVLAPPVWSRESHKTFSANTRAEIRLFLLVNLRMGKFKLGRDLLQHLFQFFLCGEPWAPVFNLHRYAITATPPVWALNKNEAPQPVRFLLSG
jgi:hypothetical protein